MLLITLLQSLIKKDDYIPSQEDINSEQNETEVTKSEASSEKTPKAGESLTASDIDAIQNLSLENQPVSDEVSIGTVCRVPYTD